MPVQTRDTTTETPDSLGFFEVFPWNNNFNTGHPLIDEQHKKLVELLNKLANTLVNNEEIEVQTAFDELARYAEYHFTAEEEIWLDCFGTDNWFHSHQLNHTSFLPRVIEMKERDPNRPLYLIVEDVVKFLIRWLAFHIIDEDKRFAMVVDEVKKGKSLSEAKSISDRKMSASSIRVLVDTVLGMYDGLSTRTLNLLRERRARLEAEDRLKEAYRELEAANKRLEELSITDQLTKLYNRRHFDKVLAEELKRAYRERTRLTLVLFDIDHFKKLNDAYGHPAGDQVLQNVAEKLREICRRPGDYTFRLGGEEFAVLACTQSEYDCKVFAEQIREGIKSLAIPNINSEVAKILTISVGVVSHMPADEDAADAWLSKADKLLYQAKQAGRDQVLHACDNT